MSRPVKGSKPIFDRFHRLRCALSNKGFEAFDNRGFRNFQFLVFVNYYYRKCYPTYSIKTSQNIKKKQRSTCIERFVVFKQRLFTDEIVSIPLKNVYIYNTNFITLKNTRYIFFIQRRILHSPSPTFLSYNMLRFANGNGKKSGEICSGNAR